MNILTDAVPKSVEIAGKSYEINTDFRTSIRFEEMIRDKNVTPEQDAFIEELLSIPGYEGDYNEARLLSKYNDGLALYYPKIPDDIKEAISKMLWFYQCGKDLKQKKAGKGRKVGQIYSFTYDADYIYAAFLEQYGIDLNVEKLHWWKFSALFMSLKKDCLISRIVYYRSVDLKGMEKEKKKFYQEMKELYKLPKEMSAEERERNDKITQALMNGGDLTGLLQ